MTFTKPEHICVQTGIACGFPCFHDCPLWGDKPKSFSELSQKEIDAMSKEQFEAVSPFEKKSCADCAHIVKSVS